MKLIDLTGKVFGSLTVVERAETRVSAKGSKTTVWKCSCTCGNKILVASAYLRNGTKTVCGDCYVRGSHRHTVNNKISPTFSSWWSAVQRCCNKNHETYSAYGAVGITICDRWNPNSGGSFENFLEDMGERKEGTTLNRVHGAKIYSKETCEWATESVQSFDQKRRITNTSGRTGVHLSKRTGRYEVCIWKDRRKIHLGVFDSFKTACEVRAKAELKYFGFIKE